MAGIGEIVQKPILACDKHSSDEVEVYCKDCSKAICFECSRIHHHDHECESISKLSRTLRERIQELCKEIRAGTLSRMQAELESIQSLQNRNKKLHQEELNSMEMLQERCIQTVKNAFKTKVEKTSEKLCKHNEKLNAREQDLIQKIKKLNVHVQAHQDSHLTYGKYEVIEIDEKLKEMTRGLDKMDIEESVYIPFSPSHSSPDLMESLDSCVQKILLEFSEGAKRKSPPERPPPPSTGTKAKPAASSLPHGDQEKDKTLEENTMQEEPSSPQGTTMQIFTSIEASVNTGIKLQEEDLKKKLIGMGNLKLNENDDDVGLWSSSFTDTEGVENILQEMRSSNDHQSNLKPNSGTDLEQNTPVQLITKLQCREIEYKALGFFHKEDSWYQENVKRIKWKRGEIYLDHASEEDNEKLKDRLKCIIVMNMYDITFESNEIDKYDTVLDRLTSNFPNAYMFEHDNVVGITAVCDSYEAITKIRHMAEVLLGRIQFSQRRRRNRFFGNVTTGGEEPSEITSESHAQTRRNRQFMASSSNSSNFSATLRNSDSFINSLDFRTPEGIRVKVYSASITRLSVDCIVNGANENLMHGGGVAYAISNAAGYNFDRESQDYIKKHGPIPVGNCCTTGAGNLPYKCVIHTVGPRWSDYNDKKQCEKDLRQAVEVTFREAVHQGCDSIAVPAISSGIFGVPKDVCVKQYYLAVVSYSQSALRPIKEIHFVDKDHRMVDCIIKNFKENFSSDKSLETSLSDQQVQGNQGISYQQSQGHSNISNQQSQDHFSMSKQQGQGHKGFSNQQGHGHSSVSNQQVLNKSTRSYRGVVQYNQSNQHGMSSGCNDEEMAVFEVSSSIAVRISVGDIIKTEVKAIVCPQDEKCQSKGGVAKAIHKVAEKMYKPGEEGRLKDLRFSDVAVLKTIDSIKWKYVFHVIPPRWNYSNTSDSYEQNLCFTYRTILHYAKEFDVKSIAIPVLGFGESGFKIVVEKNSTIFPEELFLFSKYKRRKDFPLDIHMVCNDKSVLTTLVKGFEKKFKRRVQQL